MVSRLVVVPSSLAASSKASSSRSITVRLMGALLCISTGVYQDTRSFMHESVVRRHLGIARAGRASRRRGPAAGRRLVHAAVPESVRLADADAEIGTGIDADAGPGGRLRHGSRGGTPYGPSTSPATTSASPAGSAS